MRGPRPEPPADLARRPLPLEPVSAATVLYRIHRATHDPIHFGPPGAEAESRFDDPQGVFKVCYLGVQREAALVETLLRNPARRTLSWTGDIEPRSLARIEVLQDLRLVDFDGASLRKLGATLEVLGTREYELPHAWSRALWEHPEVPDGIFYCCRHDNRATAIALFERARSRIRFLETHPLGRELSWLGEMAARYGFGLTA